MRVVLAADEQSSLKHALDFARGSLVLSLEVNRVQTVETCYGNVCRLKHVIDFARRSLVFCLEVNRVQTVETRPRLCRNTTSVKG